MANANRRSVSTPIRIALSSTLLLAYAACSLTPVGDLQRGSEKNPDKPGATSNSGNTEPTAPRGTGGLEDSGVLLVDAATNVDDSSTPTEDAEATPIADADVPPLRNALFVVGNLNLNDADSEVRARLQGLGYTLQLVNSTGASNADTTLPSLIVISKTINVDDVRTTFRNVKKPVLLWEPLLYDDMGMVPANPDNTRGTVNDVRTIDIVDPASPLAAGLTGTVEVLAASPNPLALTFGIPNDQALRVATITGQAERFAIFAYETGVTMPGLVAPARRVALFLADSGATLATAAAWAFFDAAVRWADP